MTQLYVLIRKKTGPLPLHSKEGFFDKTDENIPYHQ